MQTSKQLGSLYFELDAYIQAAEGEGYPDSITQDTKAFNKLVKLERAMQKDLAVYFKTFANQRVARLIDWGEYRIRRRKAAELVVEVNAAAFEDEQKILLNVLFDYIVEGEGIAANASSTFYNVPIDELNLQAAIQREARQYSNRLVTNINKTTRAALQSNLNASIDLGEDIDMASKRIAQRIGDPQRAVTIARTESVNSYGQGVNTFGKTTGAKGKVADVVQDERTSPICKEIASKYGSQQKAIPLNQDYTWSAAGGGSKPSPGFHVNCRTGHWLLY